MEEIKCKECGYDVLCQNGDSTYPIYPNIRDTDGDKVMINVSPTHGRSYIVGEMGNGRFVISKGNGLSYSLYNFINTREIGDETLGLLLKKDAIRDFKMGIEIESLGIKTNKMEYVLELENTITLPTGNIVHPVLLQYDVECPYRISDAAFMEKRDIEMYVERWGTSEFTNKHLQAADILIRNLRILHDHGILHNAITVHNITWSLELLDFELACSKTNPYDLEEERRHVKDLFPREIIGTFQIIRYIAGVLKEKTSNKDIENIFNEYGFQLKEYKI